jgi:predicted DNA-binding antitoxin AbrB/MazE fold protein
MTLIVDATWEGGVLTPKQRVELPEGIEVRISIDVRDEDRDPLADVIGIGDAAAVSDAAQQHDRYLYGNGDA